MSSRKIVRVIALLCTMVLVLAACASSSDSGSDDDGGGDEKPATLQTGAGVDEANKTITLGILTPQTTAFAALGTQVTNGNKIFFDALNEAGGINGEWTIEFVEADTEYTGDKARTEYQRIKGDVAAFAQILGTEVTNNLLPLLEEDQYGGAVATLDGEWVIEPNLIPALAPYQIEMINGAAYYEETEGFDGKNACVLRQDDSYGDAGQEGADFAATELGFEIKTSASFATGDDMTAQIQQLQDADCDVVFQASTLIDSPSAWGRAEAVGFEPRWIGLGPAWSSSFATGDQVQYIKDNVWIMAEDGASLDTSIEGVQKMLDDRASLGREDTPINLFSLFGYISAWSTQQILSTALENNDITPAGIVRAINQEQTLSFEGAAGDYEFGPDRNPPRVNAVFTAGDDPDTGLETVELSVTSDAAEAYSF